MTGGLLVLGSTGMLGGAVVRAARARGLPVQGAARSGAEHHLDVRDSGAVEDLLARLMPGVVVNCVANTALAACEEDPGDAYLINSRPAALLAEMADQQGFRLIQVSTDQYWTGDGRRPHAEGEGVSLLNEYARTKYAGEVFASSCERALIVRTNVTGPRGDAARPTFVEWAFAALRGAETIELFDDFITSTMPASTLADAILDLGDVDVTGTLNVAAREPASKLEFVLGLAALLGRDDPPHRVASVQALHPPRAESLVLDVSAAERTLGRRLPTLEETLQTLIRDMDGAAA